MQWMRTLVVAPVALALLATACAQPAAPAPGGAEQPSGPKAGGVLNTVITSDPNDWDVRTQGKTTVNVQTHGLVYETLLRFKKGPDVDYASQVLEPRLAERWEVSPDGKAFTFTLRKGVKFQNVAPVNGRALTAADVKWSLEYYSASGDYNGKKLPASQVDFMYTGLSRIDTPDPSTVVVRFNDAYAPFVNYTASQWMPIAAHEVFDQDGSLQNRLIGTGPFMFDDKESKKGSVWVVRKNPDYWDSAKPHLDSIRKLVLPDTATAQAAFQTKQLDVWVINTTFGIARGVQQANTQATYYKYQVPIGNALLVSQRRGGPLADARVRRAISLAMDREEHNKVLYGGDAKPFLAGSWPGLFTDAEIQSLVKYDPEEAKRLLAQAGQAQGLSLEMIITDTEETTQHQLIQSQLKKVGVDVKFVILPREQHRARLYKGDFDIYRNSGQGLLEADVDSFLYGEFHSGSTLNWTGINDPELDKSLIATRTSLAPEARREAIRSAVKRINEQGWDPGIVVPANWAFAQTYVKNWRPHFAGGESEAFTWLDK